jgi:CubicO group peptidase (beta-lactamase class C family)
MKSAEHFLSGQISNHRTPGIQYYFFNQDTILYSYHGGYADLEKGKKVTGATTFHAYSVTKTFTALAILQLEEQGRVDLDRPVLEYLPEFPYPSDITIRHLLTHTSGISNPLPLKWVHTADQHDSFHYEEFFETVFRQSDRTKFRPGEKFAYSNLGYVLLGMLIGKVSGQGYVGYVREQIIIRAGIPQEKLDFTIPDINLHAKGYQKRFSFTSLILGILLDTSKMIHKKEGRWISAHPFYVNGAPYGGMVGSGMGFTSYVQELLKPDSRFLSDEYKAKLFKENKTNNGKATGMCLGWFMGNLKGHTYFAHAGGGGFYYCEVRIYPESGSGSVVMFNRSGMTDARFLDKVDLYFIT